MAVVVVLGWFQRVSRAYSRVQRASELASLYVGGSASVSREMLDFQVLLRHPRARAMFADLASQATPAGKVYGLCGLYHLDRDQFLRAKAALADRGDPVRISMGCLLREETLASLVAEGSVPLEARCERMKLGAAEWSQAVLASSVQAIARP